MIFVNFILYVNVILIVFEWLLYLFYSWKVLIGFFLIDVFRLYGFKKKIICSNKFENKRNENYELVWYKFWCIFWKNIGKLCLDSFFFKCILNILNCN